MSKCLIQDCANQGRTRGWCPKHYTRWWTYGDPLFICPPRPKNTTPAIVIVKYNAAHWARDLAKRVNGPIPHNPSVEAFRNLIYNR